MALKRRPLSKKPHKDTNKKAYRRPSWDEYFLSIANLIGTRGTCDRGRSGCILVCDKHILSTGYVGSPSGLPHCDHVGHELHTVTHENGRKSKHCVRTTHAEQNAIAQAARVGIALEGSTLYCHMTPCYTCAKIILNAGIVRVVCDLDYHDGKHSKKIFKEAGIKYSLVNDEIEVYDHQA